MAVDNTKDSERPQENQEQPLTKQIRGFERIESYLLYLFLQSKFCFVTKDVFLHLLFQNFRGLMAACASGFSLFASIVLRPDNYEVIRMLALPLPHRVDYLKEAHAYCNMISTFLCLALSQFQYMFNS